MTLTKEVTNMVGISFDEVFNMYINQIKKSDDIDDLYKLRSKASGYVDGFLDMDLLTMEESTEYINIIDNAFIEAVKNLHK